MLFLSMGMKGGARSYGTGAGGWRCWKEGAMTACMYLTFLVPFGLCGFDVMVCHLAWNGYPEGMMTTHFICCDGPMCKQYHHIYRKVKR